MKFQLWNKKNNCGIAVLGFRLHWHGPKLETWDAGDLRRSQSVAGGVEWLASFLAPTCHEEVVEGKGFWFVHAFLFTKQRFEILTGVVWVRWGGAPLQVVLATWRIVIGMFPEQTNFSGVTALPSPPTWIAHRLAAPPLSIPLLHPTIYRYATLIYLLILSKPCHA